MADDQDPDETSAELQEPGWEIPGIPDDSLSSVNASRTSPKMSKIQSLASTILQSGTPSVSASVHKEDDRSTEPERQSHQEESSKSQEELKLSQELPLNGKKTSLDQLSKDVSQTGQKPRASRLHRQCQRRFRELIGKRELKNEELEKQQGDLKQRLNILECSMPAVMVWNIWRMSQGAGVASIKQVLEKQFQGPASGEVYCPSTPSRHFDCRVREVEAERKQAQKRAEEARSLWAEKASALEEKNKQLEEAKEVQKQIKENIEKLKGEAETLREAAASEVKDEGACESGECGVIECRKKWLEKVPSSASIKSTDIECLEKLQQLAETELCVKKQIADLERREEAYMRTLQQADELWSKLQGDAASTASILQEQLDVKTAANQQMADRIVQLEDSLEKLRTKMANCKNELEKYMSIGKIEALIGGDDDFADVADGEASAEVIQWHKMVGRRDDIVTVEEKSILSKEETSEKDIMAKPGVEDAASTTRADAVDLATGVHRADFVQVDDGQLGIKSEDFSHEKQRLEEAKEYLASYESLSELFADDDYVCPPDFSCNDQVFTDTGLTEEELTALKEGRVTAEMLLEKLNKDIELSAGVVPATMMRTIKRTERAEETAKQPPEVEEEEMIVVNEITVESGRKIDDEQETPVTALKETEIDAAQEAFIEAPGPEEEIVERIATEDEAEDYTSFKDAANGNNILVPRDELMSWQSNVDAVRGTIAKCPDCLVVKKDADEVAEMMARHTGIPMKEVIDDPRRKEREVEESRVMEQVAPAEVEVREQEKRKTEPEVKKVESITVPPAKQEVLEDVAAPTTRKEVEDVEDPTTQKTVEEVAEVQAPSFEKHAVATPTASVMQEVSKEASKASAPEVASSVKESAPPAPPKEEIPPLMEEVAPVADERGPKETQKGTVEPIETDIVPTAVNEETVASVKVDEVKETPVVERTEVFKAPTEEKVPEVEVVEMKDGLPDEEVPPSTEEKTEVKQVASPEEEKTDVHILTTEEEELEAVKIKVPIEKKEEAPAPKGEETEAQVLPESDEEMDTAQKKEIEVDLLPETEEKEASKEEKVVIDTLEEEEPEKEVVVEILPDTEEIVVELQSQKEEEVVELLPKEKEGEMPEEEIAVELQPQKEEEVVELLPKEKEGEMREEEIAVELLPEEIEETPQEKEIEAEMTTEEEEMAVELLPEEKEAETTKEEEIEVEMITEKEEISEPTEEEEEPETEPPTDEAEEVTVLVAAVLAEEEVEIEVEEIPEPEEVQEIPVVEMVDEGKIEQVEEVPVEVYTTAEVPEAALSEEVITLPCVCSFTQEVSEVPAPEEVATLPCVCSPEPETPKAPEETHSFPCVCSTSLEEPTPVASKTLALAELHKLCTCSTILETPEVLVPEAPVPEVPVLQVPAPEVPLIFSFVSPLPVDADHQTEPCTKIEFTQTEFTTTMESIQVVTQTVSDMGTQTPPLNRMMRRSQPPKIITITRPVDPELEILSQLTQRLRPITEPSLTITTTTSVQTEKSSFLQVKATGVDSRPPSLRISEILQSLKAEVAHLNRSPRSDQEEELKTIHYGRKPKEPEKGKCNCCMCGKDVLSSVSADSKAQAQRQSSTVFRILPPPSTMQKSVVPGTHQAVQHETICPECRIRKSQKSLSSQESFRFAKEETKKSTRDKEVCACSSFTPRGIPFSRLKKKIDRSCTARISKAGPKFEKPLKRDKVDPEKEVRELAAVAKAEDKESLMHCVCSTEIETGEPGVLSRVHCACGDPD